MTTFNATEFRPTIMFLAKFLGLYLAGNLLYGVYINSYEPAVDPITHVVTSQTAWILNACGLNVGLLRHAHNSTTSIIHEARVVVSVYEGCNSINTMIIFVAFVLGFGPYTRVLLWFIPAGLAVIYVVNLGRIGMLYYVSEYEPEFMYFTHKYLFTAILYVVIFALWIVWVRMAFKRQPDATS
ncbi:MAG TPA: exosortase family protein XrtF [Chryseosolibacter sp.]|nr:exosortase family protein XrtF [Chryseosolibacter sp.]